MRSIIIICIAELLALLPPTRKIRIVLDTEIDPWTKSRWHPKLQELVGVQSVMDSVAFAYTPDLSRESRMENTLVGRLTLDEKIGGGRYSAVYSVVENPNLVIKYQSNCNRQFLPHPSLMDFWGLSAARDAGIQGVPRVYAVSPAVRTPRGRTPKSDFSLPNSMWHLCAGFTVRYVVMERLDTSLSAIHARGPVHADQAISYGLQIMETLKKLHLAGIFHGDIHAGNIMVDSSNIVKIVDFDRFDFERNYPVQSFHPFQRVHRFLSHWEIRGFTSSYRDDIYRAVSVVAELLQPFVEYEAFMTSMSELELLFWKERGFLFSALPKEFVGDNLGLSDPHSVGQILKLFDQVLLYARSPLVAVPQTHDAIIALFKQIESLLLRY